MVKIRVFMEKKKSVLKVDFIKLKIFLNYKFRIVVPSFTTAL